MNNGAFVIFPQNGIVNAQGLPYTGQVSVSAFFFEQPERISVKKIM